MQKNISITLADKITEHLAKTGLSYDSMTQQEKDLAAFRKEISKIILQELKKYTIYYKVL